MAKKSGKIPKKIAGVKIPKQVRTRLAPVARAAEHPLVADLIAAGITAASAAIVNSRTIRRAAAQAGDEAADAADATAKEIKRSSNAIKSIAIDFARHFIDAYEAESGSRGSVKAGSAKPRSKRKPN